MAGSANELQKAVFARLAGDAALTGMIGSDGIFDHRRTGTAMPYLVVAAIETSDFGAGCEEHALQIEAWSDGAGLKQAHDIAARVSLLLNGAALVLTGFVLVNLQHVRTRTRRETKSRALVAEMTFRAVTE